MAKLLMDRINGTLSVNAHDLGNLLLDGLLGSIELGQVSAEARNLNLVGQIVLDGVWKYKVTVGKTLQKSRCTQTVSSVV